jgi:tetratricopeptide (TPR) repeat protein
MVVLGDRPRQILREANLHMERGEYRRAAEMFENLGKGAQAHGMLQRAPHLYLQAGRARLYAGQIDPALALLRQGLVLLADLQRWDALQRNASLAVAELQRLGHNEQANQIQAWLEQTLKSHPEITAVPTESAAPTRPSRLPAKCPFCGASVRPDEIEWLDEVTAECPYCGSSVLGEEQPR